MEGGAADHSADLQRVQRVVDARHAPDGNGGRAVGCDELLIADVHLDDGFPGRQPRGTHDRPRRRVVRHGVGHLSIMKAEEEIGRE